MGSGEDNRDDAPDEGPGAGEGVEEDADSFRARFPDLETDERLRVPPGDTLPEVPKATYERPAPRPEGSSIGVPGRPDLSDLRGMGAASTIGITLVVSIAIGAGLGWLADKFLLHSGATPWGLIVGFLMGTASGFINLVRVANRLNRDE